VARKVLAHNTRRPPNSVRACDEVSISIGLDVGATNHVSRYMWQEKVTRLQKQATSGVDLHNSLGARMTVRILSKWTMFRWLGSGLMGLALVGFAQAQAVTQAKTPTGAPLVQVSGTRVHGTITDPDGALIPGATVTLTPASGQGISTKTGQDGTYSLVVPSGSYTVLVTMPGFATYSAINMKIPAVPSTTLDAKLQIGMQSQVVTVEANTVQLSVDPDSNQSATILTGKDLEALSDDPDELSSELSALAGPSAGPNGGQIYVDGFTGGQLPPKSSIREIRINQNPFSAQYDKLGFGRIEVFTKPGTDKIHGNFQINGNPSQFNSEDSLENGVYVPPYHTIFSFGNLTGPLSKIASYSIGGSYRAIQDDAFTNATLYGVVGATTPCPAGATTSSSGAPCVQTAAQVSTNTPQTRFDISPRVDVALGDKNVLTTRFEYEQNDQHNQGIGNFTLPSAAYTNSTNEAELQMSDSENFSTRLINETRFEYSRDHTTTTPLNSMPTVTIGGDFTSGGYSGQSLTDHQDHFEVQNYTSLQLKKNFIRFGGRLRTTREAQNSQGNTNGSFTYTSLLTPTDCISKPTQGTCIIQDPVTLATSTVADNSYQSGVPSQFSLTQVNVPKVDFTLADLGVYAETDWKVKPNLTVSYGFRYETQNHLRDHHDFAPRASLSYGLFTGKGAPKTVLRAGFGMFYDRFGQANVLTLEQENGTNQTIFTVDQVPAACSPNTFNPGLSSSVAACTAAATVNAATVYSAGSGLRTPYTTQAALGADEQIGKFGTVSLNYIHSQGAHQLATENVGYDVATQSSPNGENYQYFTEGAFKQNQLTINGHVQTSKWVSLFGYYALNSVHGDTSGAGSFVSTPYNLQADYGRTSFDVRQRIFLGGSITLPKFIQLSPFMIGQSGKPYNVTTGSDNNNDSIYNDRPYLVDASLATPANAQYVKTIPGCGTFAEPGYQSAGAQIAPINDCTGPSLFTLNFRLTKTFGFGASTKPVNPGGGPGGPGGPGGDHGHGGEHRGGGAFGFGGGSSTGRKYNLAVGLQVQNLFNNQDLANPVAVLSSNEFGQSTQVSGGPYTTNSALRRISLQTSFNF
jgi:hypothetical protein